MSAISNRTLLWPKGQVVYFIDPSLRSQEGTIQQAMEHIRSVSCITFRPYESDDKSYIHIYKYNDNFSHVGRTGGGQPMGLTEGVPVGCVLQQLLRALGFHAHYSRSDRDQYLEIRQQNVSPSDWSQFNRLQPYENTLYTQFDYGSIMMQGSHHCSANGAPTMVPRQAGVRLVAPGEKTSLSQMDIVSLKRLYGC